MTLKTKKRIWDLIHLVDVRNDDEKVSLLLWVTVEKKFIPSVANTIWTDMSNYKIIRKWQFACSLMQVRRDKKIPVALLKDYDEAIVTSAYPVFEVNNESEILPEYLMMWFSRKEFDRESCFYAVWWVRWSLEWEDFCNMKLPIPPLQEQQRLIDEYNIIQNRININNNIIQKLEKTAHTIYKQRFIDFDFPNNEWKPYKSSGWEMVYCKELEKNIPNWWWLKRCQDVAPIITGKEDANFATENWKYKFFTCSQWIFKCDKPAFNGSAVLIAWNWDFNVKFFIWEFNAYQRTYVLVLNDNKYLWALYLTAKNLIDGFKKDAHWTTIEFITKPDVEKISLLEPPKDNVFFLLNKCIEWETPYINENEKLMEISDILLSSLAGEK